MHGHLAQKRRILWMILLARFWLDGMDALGLAYLIERVG